MIELKHNSLVFTFTGRAFVMPRWVYILKSQSTGRFYCGQTNQLAARLEQHNDPTNDLAKTTKRFKGPWTLVWGDNSA